jgi:PAS domain-containing protein
VSYLNDDSKLLLISFQETAEPVKAKRHRAAQPAELTRIKELENELAYLKENYQATIEEQQTANEELKSTNEEFQSTNEELQSTNEELETSKEELQSVNEELITVNSELQSKIEQLANVQNDMKNLLDNVNMGIIFLDTHLVIRRFTRDALRVYRLVASDVGRPLLDIKSPFTGDELLVAAQTVLDTLIPHERELHIGSDNWLLVRIQPYRTLDNVIDGVVLTFNDISKRVQNRLEQTELTQQSEIRLALILADTDLAAWDWDIVTGQVIFNERWATLRGMTLNDVAPQIQSWQNSIVPADFIGVEKILAAHLNGHTAFFKAEYRIKTSSGAAIWVMNRGTVIARDAQGKPLHMSNIEINITKRVQMETTV